MLLVAGGAGSVPNATFLLHVTDASAHWHSGVFSLTSAMCAWGPEDRCAFLAWAAAPWGGSHDRK